jgi:hypothetical protein
MGTGRCRMSADEPEVTKKIVDQIDEKLMADGKLTVEERDLLHRMVAKYKESGFQKLKPIEDLVDRITADGKLTREEVEGLGEAIMEDGEVSSEEMMILRDIVSRLSSGELEEA